MKAVILAGGLGTRLAEETVVKPKPLVEVGGLPMLWHIFKIYSHFGVNDFIVCCGYKGYMIKEYFANYFMHTSDITFHMDVGNHMEVLRRNTEPWKVTLIDTGYGTETGGRLGRVRHYLDDESFCFTYGDGVADIDIGALIEHHKKTGLQATLTAVQPPGRYGALNLEGDQVANFKEKADGDNAWVNGGFMILEPSVCDLVQSDSCMFEADVLSELARRGQLGAYRHYGFWQSMDTLRERYRLESLWESGKAPWKLWP